MLIGKTARILLKVTIVMYSIYGLIILIIAFFFVKNTFADPTFDTFPVTGAGFAILASCASICFGWSRAYEQGSERSRVIRLIGEMSFVASLLFVFGAFMKYFDANILKIGKLEYRYRKHELFKDALEYFLSACFCYCISAFANCLHIDFLSNCR
jgi:hypothetical protein